MDKNKVYSLVYSLPLSIDQKDVFYKALIEGDNTEVEAKLVELKKQVDTINAQVNTINTQVDNTKKQVDAIKVPTKATKDVAGTVNAMSNIVNLDAENATLATVIGAFNTLLVNLRTAGMIQV